MFFSFQFLTYQTHLKLLFPSQSHDQAPPPPIDPSFLYLKKKKKKKKPRLKENRFPKFSQPPNRISEPTHTIEISKLLKQFKRIRRKHNVSSTPEPKPQENQSDTTNLYRTPLPPTIYWYHSLKNNFRSSGFGQFLGFGLLDTMVVGFYSSKNSCKIFNLRYWRICIGKPDIGTKIMAYNLCKKKLKKETLQRLNTLTGRKINSLFWITHQYKNVTVE